MYMLTTVFLLVCVGYNDLNHLTVVLRASRSLGDA